MTQQPSPKMDWGFYASVPRIVRTEYKNLSPTQKWLYVCLKDLCGNHGTCFRTLRSLSEETGISIAMLSESIRALHSEGLIHAEKKKRTANSTKAVWHITIADIWQANGKAHPTKNPQGECSPNEQTTGEYSPNEQSATNIHTANKNIHTANKGKGECSPNEPEEKQVKNNNTKNKDNVRTDEPSVSSSSVSSSSVSSSSVSSSSDSSANDEKQAPTSVFTPEENMLLSWLEEDRVRKAKDETALKGQLQELLPHVKTKEQAHSLFLCAWENVQGKKNPTVWVGNLTGDTLNAWLQTQRQEPTSYNAQDEPKEPEIEACETEQVSTPASRPQRHRTAMTPGIANELSGQILAAYPDAHVQICDWNGVLQRVYLAYGDGWVEFANRGEWKKWEADAIRQLNEVAV